MSRKSESTSRGDSLDAAMTSLKVAVRVRPLNDKEINLGSKIVVDVLGNDIVITDLKVPEHQGYDHRSRIHKFSFDYGFSSVDPESEQYASQATVFENFGRVVLQALLEGYNCCVIAYGQSGSGKTYTMMGMKDKEGLTPRICEGLLMKLEDKAKQNISFAVNISYMEIYNEQVYDLLQKPDESTNYNKSRLRVREHPIHGPFVEGLSTHVLRSRDNVCQLISEGNDNRVKAATYIHERSSRSHAIFTVHCSQACLDESQPKEVVSKLQLVDLAGSEKAGHEFCQSRLKEGASINKSLVTLGNVISALVELSQRHQNGSNRSGRQLFVPYRDSQLTWLMKDSLGGNSHTFMLAAVSPSNECYSETLSTLRYAQRAKSVLSVPVVNEDPATKIIRNLRLEVNKMKSLLTNAEILSKKAIIEPLSNLSHLNFIMKKSEKKVDHLTKCWFKKWLETYNSILKETNCVDQSSPSIKGTNVLPMQNVTSIPTVERTDTTPCDYNVDLDISEPHALRLKMEDSETVLSEKSTSSVSSECIILPNDIIFYSKGKRSDKDKNYFENSKPNVKSASLNHVTDTKCEIIVPPDNCDKTCSSPVFHLHCSSLSSISQGGTAFKSLPVLNHLSVFTPSLHSSVSSPYPLFPCFSLPKDIQALPESIGTAVETEEEGINLSDESKVTSACLEKACRETETNSSDCVYKGDAKVTNNEELSQGKMINYASENYINTVDHSVPMIPACSETLLMHKSEENQSICGFNTSNSTENCLLNTAGHGCAKVEFNDSVAEESNNLVQLLNQLQDGSVETISPCFQRKDSEILSLLSLSSNDYPPFYSLDDIFDDDAMELPGETDNIELNSLSESEGHYMQKSWNEVHSSADVTDESECSDAESEFDYLDFTKNAAETSETRIHCDSCTSTTFDVYQNLEGSGLRQINKENLLSIPENAEVHQILTNSDASALHSVEPCCLAGDKCVDVHYVDKALTTRSETKPVSEDLVHIGEIPCKLSPLVCDPAQSCHSGDSPLLCSKNLTTDSEHQSNNINNSAEIPGCRNEEHFIPYTKKICMLQNRLCNSDSTLKVLPSKEVKCSSKSDNTVFTAPEKFSVPEKVCSGSSCNEKETEISCKNTVNNDICKKTLVGNKDSISDLLGFSVQDILDLFHGKSSDHCGTCLTKQIHPASEEKLQSNDAMPEEIQNFIDSTEITDANKLAGELLNKKLSECQTSMVSALPNNDSELTTYSDKTKILFKPKLCSSYSGSENEILAYYDEKLKGQNLKTNALESIHHSLNYQPDRIQNVEKRVSSIKEDKDYVTTNVPDIIHTATLTNEIEVEASICSQENGNSEFFKNLPISSKEVYCGKENTLEYFISSGMKGCLLDSVSEESDYLDDSTSINSKAEKSSKSGQISVDDERLAGAEVNTLLFSSDFSTDSAVVDDVNSQASISKDYPTFENFNITSLAPIQEETVDDDDDAISDVSEDDSPNISFQFDSLERPKNTPLFKKDSSCEEQFGKSDGTGDGNMNTGQQQFCESEKPSNMFKDVTKTIYNKNFSFMPSKPEEQAQNIELLDSDISHVKSSELSKGNFSPKDILNFPSTQCAEETTSGACELANEFQDLESHQPLTKGNCDRHTVTNGEIIKTVNSCRNNLDFQANHVKELNTNQLCSWDSLSSSTSSDSITFVFVGKENRDVLLGTNSRSFQSSLFSSVSLDSLEKSSIHQNQIACASPRTLSIDSLVAEELLFQLRNSDPVQPLASETKQTVSSECEMNSSIHVDQKSTPKQTSFAATSLLSSNQHLKMYRHTQSNMEGDVFFRDVNTEISEMKTYEKQNVDYEDQTVYHSNTFPQGSYSGKVNANEVQNSRENYFCISPESNNDVPSNHLRTANSKEYKSKENIGHSALNDCGRENPLEDSLMCTVQKHTTEENALSACANDSIAAPHFNCIDFGNPYDLEFRSNTSSVVLDEGNLTASTKSLEHSATDNYSDVHKQVYFPENMCSKEDRFCEKYVKSDRSELCPVKELTEENLKIFNSEFEENQEDTFILPPPSTFGGSEDNGFSVVSNCSSLSLDHHQSKSSADVISKSTQTDYAEHLKLNENSATSDARSTDLLGRMMDLMVETLKLMKEQYSMAPKQLYCHPRRKLCFSNDSDKNVANQKVLPTDSKHRKCLSKKRTANSKVMKYIQTVLPVCNESDNVIENFNCSMEPELMPYTQRAVDENSVHVKNKINHGGQRTGCTTAKKPNFYTLPFDFITSKYQGKKLPNASKLKKPNVISQASVDCLPGKIENPNMVNNECNNLAALKSTQATKHKLFGPSEMFDLKQSHPKPNSTKDHLKHLIELRRQVVEATIGSSNVKGNPNCENNTTDPLKSASSSSEGYLSSVSSKGAFRQLSAASTDSRESSCTAEQLLAKQCLPKHSVKPLDFSSQCHRDIAVSPDMRWLNTSADSGAFFLDSPGTDKKSNLDEYPTAVCNGDEFIGAASSSACTSSKKPETRSPVHHSDILLDSANPQQAKIPALSRIRQWDETKHGRKSHCVNDFAPGFQDLDEIGENYLDISLQESVSVNSSTSSDLSFCAGKSSRSRNPSSRTPRSSPKLKYIPRQEVQKLLQSIERDRRLLQQLQSNHAFSRKCSSPFVLPSSSSLETIDDLFYQDCYKSLPSPPVHLNSVSYNG